MSRGQATDGGFDEATRHVMPERGSVRALLLRHGDVAGFARRGVRGQADVPLSTEGHRQHGALVDQLVRHGPRPARVISSDLSRCRDLGARLAAATGAELLVDERLREQDMGRWEGRRWGEISADAGLAVNDYWDDYVNAAPPGGESLACMAERVRAVWREHATPDTDGERCAAFVTHIGPLRVLLCDALGLPLDQALRWAPPAASLSTALTAAAGCVLEGVGERAWLDGAPERVAPDAPRVALSGSAGTGKTTLGRRLAEALQVPFLEEPMRARLEDGLDLHSLSHDDLRRLVLELWEHQRDAEAAASDGFVADRSAADYAAFWIHYGFHHDPLATEPVLQPLLAHVANYDRIVLLPWGVLPLADDGVRSTNRWIQFMFQSLVEGFLGRHATAARLLRMPAERDLERRLEHVLQSLGRGAD